MSRAGEKASSESEDEEEVLRKMQEYELKLERIRKKKASTQKNSEEAELLPKPASNVNDKKYDTSEFQRDGSSSTAKSPGSEAKMTKVSPTSKASSTKSSKTGILIPPDWTNAAFGSFTSTVELDKRLALLNSLSSGINQPSVQFKFFPVKDSDIDTVVCVKGKLVSRRESNRGKLEIDVVYQSDSVEESESIRVTVVESGVGKDIFKKVASALQAYCEKDGLSLVVKGMVQLRKNENDQTPFICVNSKAHIFLIEVEPMVYPVVHDMNGNPIDFPMSQSENNAHMLLGTFPGAWFCPLSDSKLSAPQVDQLRQHISAYRGSGGGVLYLGLNRKKIGPNEYQVDNLAVKLSPQNLEELKKQVEAACSAQCPPCCAREWDSRVLPDDIKQRFDHCFNTYFTTSDCLYFVVRMIVCPSKHSLHLCSEKDIGLHKRHGTTSSSYPIDEFISKMSETSLEVSQELGSLLTAPTNPISISVPVVKDGQPFALLQQLPFEGDSLDNKELCFAHDPVEKTIKMLEDYVAVWLNDTTSAGNGGMLRIGVSDRPPMATGVWFDNDMMDLLKQRLVQRFKGSLEQDNFCFPSAIGHFTLIKHQIFAHPDAVLGKNNQVLVLWLKVPQNSSYSCGFEPHGLVIRKLYCLWAKKTCPDLKLLFNLGKEHPALVLPLNSCLRGLVPPTQGGLPVAISRPHSLSQEDLETVASKLCNLDCVISHQLVDCSNVIDILDGKYCVLDVMVSPSKHSLLHLCKLPAFWKLDKSREEESHIGGSLRQMNFHEIAIRCGDSSLAENHLSTFFQFNNDRPILITDVGNLDCSSLKGLACIPWTLVIDFDFDSGSPNANTLRDLAEKEAAYVYKIKDLPLNNFGPVNTADMSDITPVYWVRALGPSDHQITDPNLWRLQLASSVCKYVTQACIAIASKVKVLVVWTGLSMSNHFGQAISDLCLAAQQANKYDRAEITVICPTLASPFTQKLKGLPYEPNILSMEVNKLSEFLLQRGPKLNSNDDWCRVPGKTSKLPMETVRSMQAAALDYLYPNIDNHLDITVYDNGLAFFEGRSRFVRWEDFKAKNVLDRPETQTLFKRVKNCLEARYDKTTVQFNHYPGAGGSTVARHVMWKLRKSFCCIVPSQLYHSMRRDVKQLIDTADGRAVLVLWDHELGIVFDELMSELKGLSVVILRVERYFENGLKTNITVHLKENLSLETLEQFYILLCKNSHFSKSKEVLEFLMLYSKRMKEEVPLFLVMVTALENKFLRLHDYVKERLVNITEEQKSILLQIAFARVYTGKALQVSAVGAKDRNWENSLPASISGLITFFQLHSRFVRMRHHCIDEIILSELSGYEANSVEWGQWLSDYVVKFIDHLRNVYPVPEVENYGNNINEFERVLRWLFHDKSYTMPISNFETLIGRLSGKSTIISCMRSVQDKLPNISRIQAHFLGDLARVFLHVDNAELDKAVEVMKEAHTLLPSDRTLYHQEGQLYFEAMTLTQSTLLTPKDPLDLASDIIKLSQKASDCFARSRTCKMQGRTSELYPWSSDLQCHIKCLTDVCSMMKCSFPTLPNPLAKHEYILNAQENIAYLLDTLSTEDSFAYSSSLKKILVLLGSNEDVDTQVEKKFHFIEECTNPQEIAKALRQVDFLLHLRYGNTRSVPERFCNILTQTIMQLIDQPRVINSVLTQKGHEDRFFELELLWEWSRYSKIIISRKQMILIIDRFMKNLTSPSLLRAKCLFFKGVTLLLELLCDHNPDVNPDEVTKHIAECNTILEDVLQNENRNWRYREFLITGHGKDLLSSKSWFWKDSIHRSVNDSNELNLGYDKRIEFREFSGQVYKVSDHHGEVVCAGLSLPFVPNSAPDSWKRVNSGVVHFYISVYSQKGLQAYPVCPLEDKRSVTKHRWIFHQPQRGRIVNIEADKGLVYFAPPDHASQPYSAKAICKIDDLSIRPMIGDLYEFVVTRQQIDRQSEPRYLASKVVFIEKAT